MPVGRRSTPLEPAFALETRVENTADADDELIATGRRRARWRKSVTPCMIEPLQINLRSAQLVPDASETIFPQPGFFGFLCRAYASLRSFISISYKQARYRVADNILGADDGTS